jgi:hypothetical protein
MTEYHPILNDIEKKCNVRRIALKILVFLLSLLVLTGCAIEDGFLTVRGRLYEWVEAPEEAESMIYSRSPIPSHISTLPVEGASLWILLDGDMEEELSQDIPFSQALAISDSDGYVEYSGSAPPGVYPIEIKIGKDGYAPAIAILIHDNNDSPVHDISVLLVRKQGKK